MLHSLGTNQVYNYPRSALLYRYSTHAFANRRGESKSITDPKDLELCPARDIKINGAGVVFGNVRES